MNTRPAVVIVLGPQWSMQDALDLVSSGEHFGCSVNDVVEHASVVVLAETRTYGQWPEGLAADADDPPA